ncbi:MAG: glycosyltransferase family 4 protein [Caulobacterales bacterium]|nr:glycosyltransferase family 4 protein [Caulobacterales bacterium]
MTDHTAILLSLCGDRNIASSRVRAFWICEELEKLGFRCTLRVNDTKLKFLEFAKEIPKHDVIIFQKTYSRYDKWLMMLANALGKRTFLDLDDAPSRTGSPRTLRTIRAMFRHADGVMVGSANLLDIVAPYQPNAALVPSGVKLSNYALKNGAAVPSQVCLGWIGNGAHYADDLIAVLREPLAAVAARHDVRFKIVGACGVGRLYEAFGAMPGLTIDFIDQLDWSDNEAVAGAIADFDIGLYPLLPNEFNQFKCGFKALEYMASGLPVVSSDIAANAAIIADGRDGFLVDGSEAWTAALTRLIEDTSLRADMGQAGRKKVEDGYDTARLARKVADIVSQARPR